MSNSLPLHLRGLSFTADTDPDLSDLALQLGQILDQASIRASDLEFLDSDLTELRRGITLRVIEQNTSDTNLLVVRYPLSEKTGRPFGMHMFFLRSPKDPFSFPVLIVIVNLRFLKSVKEVRLPHITGLWHKLLARSRTTDECLQEGETQDFFVDQETDRNIDDEFTFNDLVTEKLGSDRLVNLKLLIRIQGMFGPCNLPTYVSCVFRGKAIWCWGIKEMLRNSAWPIYIDWCNPSA